MVCLTCCSWEVLVPVGLTIGRPTSVIHRTTMPLYTYIVHYRHTGLTIVMLYTDLTTAMLCTVWEVLVPVGLTICRPTSVIHSTTVPLYTIHCTL